MVSMSLEVELSIFGARVPFIAERNIHTWPEFVPGEPDPKPADKWDTLALLIEGHNDGTVRRVRTPGCPKNRLGVGVVHVDRFYNRGDWAGESTFLIGPGVISELRDQGWIAGTPRMGYTDDSELKLTDRGRQALVDHLKGLAKAPTK